MPITREQLHAPGAVFIVRDDAKSWSCIRPGSRVVLHEDDGTSCLWFRLEDADPGVDIWSDDVDALTFDELDLAPESDTIPVPRALLARWASCFHADTAALRSDCTIEASLVTFDLLAHVRPLLTPPEDPAVVEARRLLEARGYSVSKAA